ncbi:Serine protease precursor MucDAlgY associated with sigma factor [Sesbania bispinosa]|nr:Serine protease precursor MucDAlgY associated with sigma factor [Sesbania bispinosa]
MWSWACHRHKPSETIFVLVVLGLSPAINTTHSRCTLCHRSIAVSLRLGRRMHAATVHTTDPPLPLGFSSFAHAKLAVTIPPHCTNLVVIIRHHDLPSAIHRCPDLVVVWRPDAATVASPFTPENRSLSVMTLLEALRKVLKFVEIKFEGIA